MAGTGDSRKAYHPISVYGSYEREEPDILNLYPKVIISRMIHGKGLAAGVFRRKIRGGSELNKKL